MVSLRNYKKSPAGEAGLFGNGAKKGEEVCVVHIDIQVTENINKRKLDTATRLKATTKVEAVWLVCLIVGLWSLVSVLFGGLVHLVFITEFHIGTARSPFEAPKITTVCSFFENTVGRPRFCHHLEA